MRLRQMAVACLSVALILPAAGTNTLLLYTGSDWDMSSAAVRKTYESKEFRKLLPSGFVCGVWDVCEGTETKGYPSNARWKHLKMRTVCFPALFAFDSEGRCYLRYENLSVKVTAKELAERVRAAETARTKAMKLFHQATRAKGPAAADLYGQGFETLNPFMPGETAPRVLREDDTSRGKRSFAKEWEALKAADPKDESGWIARFTEHDGYEFVTKADALVQSNEVETAELYVAALRARNTKCWTPTQQQSVDIAEFAVLKRLNKDPERRQELLENVATLDDQTVWGRAAVGLLELERDPSAKRQPELTKTAPRPRKTLKANFRFDDARAYEAVKPVLANPTAAISAEQRLQLLKLHAFDLIGDIALEEVAEREGGAAFIKAFFSDADWLEDFLTAGPIVCPDLSFQMLDTLAFNCGEEYVTRPGLLRRLATAVAINCGERPAGRVIATFNAYKQIAQARRFHRSALKHTIFDWRRVVGPGHDAKDLLFANGLDNAPSSEWTSEHEFIHYRTYNCFGALIHDDWNYFKAWYLTGWNHHRAAYAIGGVCGSLSMHGVLCDSSHFVPVEPCSQPVHCAYAVKRPDNTWHVGNNVKPYTSPLYRIGDLHGFAQFDLMTRLYVTGREKTLASELLRFVAEIAAAREGDAAQIRAVYAAAGAAQPENYELWRSWWKWLDGANANADERRAWADAAGAAMADTRDVFWTVLEPYFRHLSGKDKTAAADEMVRFHGIYRTSRVKVFEEMNYGDLLKRQEDLLYGAPDEMFKVLLEALKQRGKDPSPLYVKAMREYGEDFVERNPKFKDAYAAAVKGLR